MTLVTVPLRLVNSKANRYWISFQHPLPPGARYSSVVRMFAYDAMDHGIDPLWWTH